MSTSDTPETDEAYRQRDGEGAFEHQLRKRKTMERLERERNQAIDQRDQAYERGDYWAGEAAKVTAQKEALRKELDEERERPSAVHSCHDGCSRPACVMRRQRDEAKSLLIECLADRNVRIAELKGERDEARREAKAWRDESVGSYVIMPKHFLLPWERKEDNE